MKDFRISIISLMVALALSTPAAWADDGKSTVIAYRLSGEKALRPAQITDDGTHTYILWDEDQPLPAVFAVNALGDEEMVDGYMRDGIFTIDRVHATLVFRYGKKRAKAFRGVK
jgi:type IV secretory pathway VirB9-like protein